MTGLAREAGRRLPVRVLVLTTGGTIASRIEHGRKVYPGGVGLMARGAGAVARDAEVLFEEIASIGSQDMSLAVWRRLHQRIERAFGDEEADAVVVTHGTDTLEETAFLLDLLIPPGPPVVLVGAMRPSDAVDADGPENLADALAVAADPASRGRGVLVAMGGEIHAARDVYKAAAEAEYVFKSSGSGALGAMVAGSPSYLRPPQPARLAGRLRLPALGSLPAVAIMYGAADMAMEGSNLANCGLAGLVTAGFGHGNLPGLLIDALATMVKRGVYVVRSSRVVGVRVERSEEIDDAARGFVLAGGLSPQKARLLLQLTLLRQSAEAVSLQSYFDLC